MRSEVLAITAPTVVATEHLLNPIQRAQNGVVHPDPRSSTHVLSGGPALDMSVFSAMIGHHIQFMSCVYNLTGKEIVAVSRNGVRNVYKPILGRYQAKVLIRQIHCISDINSPALDRYYHHRDLPDHVAHEFKEIQDAYNKSRHGPTACFDANQPRYVFVISDAIVTESMLETNTSLYINNRDIVLSYLDVDHAPHHPFDELETSVEAAERVLNQQIGAGLLYDIVDNEQKYGDRYAIFGKQVVRIPSRRDPTRSDGVYIYQTLQYENQRKIVTASYGLDEAESLLGLYRSESDAMAGGDTAAVRKLELEALSHHNTVLQAQLKEAQIKHDQDLTAARAELARQEMLYRERNSCLDQQRTNWEHKLQFERSTWERDRLNMDRELQQYRHRLGLQETVRKDYYDDRSHRRKDLSEELKFWPVLITASLSAAAGAFVAFRGLKT